jgi:hypothetical protein
MDPHNSRCRHKGGVNRPDIKATNPHPMAAQGQIRPRRSRGRRGRTSFDSGLERGAEQLRCGDHFLVEVPGLCRRPLFQFVRMRQLRIGEHSFRHRRSGRSAMSPQALLLAVVGANALASALFATDESDWSAPPQHSFDQSWRRSIAIRQHTAARILRRKITGQ